jgi:amidophosphoribosyltransferase
MRSFGRLKGNIFGGNMIRHNCGIFGVYNAENAIDLTYYGLFELQHRGEEGAGIIANTPAGLFERKCEGLVSELVRGSSVKAFPPANSCIGQIRYSTTGGSSIANLQPFVVQYGDGFLALAHNGNLVNYCPIKRELVSHGAVFRSTTDSEIFLHLIAQSKKANLTDAIISALKRVEGAYSLLILSPKELFAVRDPYGFRPLEMGKLNGATIFASETCALDFLGAEHICSVRRGELIRVSQNGVERVNILENEPERFCLFELIYFARPDSLVNGYNVYEFRKRLGKILAELYPVEADAVIPVPDSGFSAAISFSQNSGIPLELGLIRSYYIGRTFIAPRLHERESDVVFKYSPLKSSIYGKRVVVIDDSIVRGTTSRRLIEIIRSAGAKEIHLRIASPPLKYPCFYGIDIPTREELIASSLDILDIQRFLGVDSLFYLPLEKIVLPEHEDRFCTACFSGEYPVPVKDF